MTDLLSLWTSELATVPHWALVLDWWPADGSSPVHAVHDATRVYSGASMIKSFVAELVSRDVAEGRLDWGRLVTVEPGHRCDGDGVLHQWHLPATIALHDLTQLSIGLSDNTAPNVLADLLGGVPVVNDRLAAAGISSRMRRYVGGGHDDPRNTDWHPDPSPPSPTGLSVVTPADHHALMLRVVGDPAHDDLVRMFRGQADRRSLARHVSDEVCFPHKTGSVNGVRHDSGVLDTPAGRLAVTCFTDGDDVVERVDHPACVAMARAMRETLRAVGLDAAVV